MAVTELYLRALMALNHRAKLFQVVMSQPWYAAMLAEWVASTGFDADEPGKVLDVGCGPGLLSIKLKSLRNTVVGVDRSEDMIGAARKTAAAASVQVELICADVMSSSLPAGEFDWVLAASLVNIVPRPQDLLHELTRLAKAGGTVSVLAPTPEMSPTAARAYSSGAQLKGAAHAVLKVWAGAAPKLDPSVARDLCVNAGLREPRTVLHLKGMVASVTARKLGGGTV
jgi:ubiquinone/menaquinone biosynthesis C-methylase UbiE